MTKNEIAKELRRLASEGYTLCIHIADIKSVLKSNGVQRLEPILNAIADQLEKDEIAD
jgi:hypothetical protein